jgi:catechol 2,3-dioxygenase-like lactoylglutathione lyase family enzyme
MDMAEGHKERGNDMDSNWEFNHSGVFAKNFDRTLQYYKSLGLAPDLPRTQNPFNPEDDAVTIEFGEIVDLSMPEGEYFLALLYIGDLELEVLHAPRERPRGEALAYGEGINHFCISVPDIDAETDKLVKKGLRIIQDFKLNGVRLEDYLDTREYGNILLSLRTPMTEEMKKRKASNGIIDWKFRGHSAVVKDLDKTVEYYQYLDIAAFQPETIFDSTSIKDIKMFGETPKTAIKAKTRTARIGNKLVLELIQPLEGEGIYKESLDRRGEGIIDLTFTVDDLDRETARLVEKGVPVIFSGKPQNGNAFACFDTREDGGDVMIKLMQR